MYSIKRESEVSIDIDAMNYEEKDGFFTFYSIFDLPGLMETRINIASFPVEDVKSIVLEMETVKDEINETKELKKEIQHLEDMSFRANLVNDLLSLNENETSVFKIDWLLKKIMKLTDEEIEENRRKRE
jgi:hypothetical protein